MTFVYPCGQEVRPGDVVTYAGASAVVELVIEPNTHASTDHTCSDTGGILLVETCERSFGRLLLTPPDGPAWEDLEFVGRHAC